MTNFHKTRGIALVAAIVVTLIVSLVAVAIASTAVSNRHMSNASYDATSSYINAQAGINIGEVILMTASGEELKNNVVNFNKSGSTTAVAQNVSSVCNNDTLNLTSNDCFWWLGDVINNDDYNDPNFLSKLGGQNEQYYNADNAATYFKLEKRPEVRTISLNVTDKLGRNFYRITSVGKGNGLGLAKLQGQIGVFTEVDTNIEIDASVANAEIDTDLDIE